MGYSLLGCDGVQSELAMQREAIPSPQTSVPVKLIHIPDVFLVEPDIWRSVKCPYNNAPDERDSA